MALLGTLQVRMGLDVAEFEVELRKVPKGIEGATSGLTGMLGGVGGAIKGLGVALAGLATFGAAKAFGEMILGANDLTDSLNDASTRLGIGIGNLQVWEATAKRAGIGTEDLEGLIKKFNKTTGEIKLNESSEQVVNAFKRIGISVAEVKSSTPDDLMKKAIEGLAKIQDPAVRATTAMQLFGKQGATALTLVNDGAEGLERSDKLLTELGLKLDEIDASKVGDANDTLDDLRTAAQAAKQKLGAELAPAIEAVGNMLLDAAKEGGGLGKKIHEGVGMAVTAIDRLWLAGSTLVNGFQGVQYFLIGMWEKVGAGVVGYGSLIVENLGGVGARAINSFITLANTGLTDLRQGFSDFGTAASNAVIVAMNKAGASASKFINETISGINSLIMASNVLAKTDFKIIPKIEWGGIDLREFEKVAPIKIPMLPVIGGDEARKLREQADTLSELGSANFDFGSSAFKAASDSFKALIGNGGELQQKFNDLDKTAHTTAKHMTEDYSGGNGVPAKTEKAMKHMTEKVLEQFNIIEEAGKKVTDSLSSAIDDFVKNGQLDFKKLTTSIIQELAALQIKSTILGGILGNPKFGGNGSGIFGGSQLGNLFSGYLSGFAGVPKAIPLDQKTMLPLEHYTNAPYNAGNSFSSFGSLFGSIFKAFSFDGGGYTGTGGRTGGVDGKGGFPALLHPNETVIDHTRVHAAAKSAQKGRRAPQINMPISIAPGVSREELSVSLQEVQKNIINVFPKLLAQGGRYAEAFGQ